MPKRLNDSVLRQKAQAKGRLEIFDHVGLVEPNRMAAGPAGHDHGLEGLFARDSCALAPAWR